MYKVALIIPVASAVKQKDFIEDAFDYARNTAAAVASGAYKAGQVIHATVTGKSEEEFQKIRDDHNQGWCQREVSASYIKDSLDRLEKDCPKEVKCQRTYAHLQEAAKLSNFNVDSNHKIIADCGTGYWSDRFTKLRVDIQAAKCRQEVTAIGADLSSLKADCPDNVVCEETYRELKKMNRRELFNEEANRKTIANCKSLHRDTWKPRFENLLNEVNAKLPQCNDDVTQEGADLDKLRERCHSQVNCEELYRQLKRDVQVSQFDDATVKKNVAACGQGFWQRRFDELKKQLVTTDKCIEKVKLIGKDIESLKSSCRSEYRCEKKYRELKELGQSDAFDVPLNQHAIEMCSSTYWVDRFDQLKKQILSTEQCRQDAIKEGADLALLEGTCPSEYKCETKYRELKELGKSDAFTTEDTKAFIASCGAVFWTDRFNRLRDVTFSAECRRNATIEGADLEAIKDTCPTAYKCESLYRTLKSNVAGFEVEENKQVMAETCSSSFWTDRYNTLLEDVKTFKCEGFVLSAKGESTPEGVSSILKQGNIESCDEKYMKIIQSQIDKFNPANDSVTPSSSVTEPAAVAQAGESTKKDGLSPWKALGGTLALGAAATALYNKDKIVDMYNSFRGKGAKVPPVTQPKKGLSKGAMAGIISSVLALLGLGAFALYKYRLRQME